MTAPRLVYDNLWRCLCPSFDAVALSRALNSPVLLPQPYLPRPPQRQLLRQPRHQPQQVQSHRAYSSLGTASASVSSPAALDPLQPPQPPPPSITPAEKPLLDYPTNLLPTHIPAASTEVLLQTLPLIAAQPDGLRRAAHLVRALLVDRHPPRHHDATPTTAAAPDNIQPLLPEIYHALMIALADDKTGSASTLRDLLAEMDALGIPKERAVCSAALRALAVHPSYILRGEVMRALSEQGIKLSVEDRYNLALGQLRDGQFELALESIEELLTGPADAARLVPAWVVDVFAVVFAQAGFHDEALQMLLHRLRGTFSSDDNTSTTTISTTPGVSPEILYFMLDQFSRALHYPGTRYLWRRTERAAALHVPDGTLTNVLLTASRHGDAPLATEAFQELVARRAKVDVHHYEALVDLHAAAGAVTDALRVLYIMAKAGVAVEHGTTRILYRSLVRDAKLLDAAFEALPVLAGEYALLPAAAGNVVIEVAAKTYGFDIAMEVYRTVQSLASLQATKTATTAAAPTAETAAPTPSTTTLGWAPTIHTFLPLVSLATDARALAALAHDFLAAAIASPAPAWFYDKLAWACAATDALGNGFKLIALLAKLPPPRRWDAAGRRWAVEGREWWMARRCVAPLARKGVVVGDPRARELLGRLEGAEALDVREVAAKIRSEADRAEKQKTGDVVANGDSGAAA